MLAKSWKKICLVILIIACLWNIISKLSYKVSFSDTINTLKQQITIEQTKAKNN